MLLCLGGAAAAQDGQNAAASVTVLLLTTDVQVAADGSDTRTQHIEMRAGNDAGALQIGQISIAFDSSAQDLAVVEAHTLKADGKTLAVDTNAIYDQTPPGQTTLIINGLRAKLIVFPQFAAGDTAVYTIRTTTRHPNFPGQFSYDELFPRTQAFNEVRETITAPKSFPLYVESHDVEASRRDDGANVIYSWHYAAPRPAAEVPVTFSPLDHTPRFFASSFKDYGQLGRAYAALAEPRQVVTPRIKALADEITAGTSDPRAQTQKLYEWVNGHIRYVGIELGTGSFIPREADAIVATGYGDCKDHDLLLQVLLKARGIESRSILLNAGESYSLTQVPTFATLDHVITFVPQFDLYLDSSAGLAPFGILPMQEYGKPMVVAARDSPGQGRMPVLAPDVAKITLKTVAALDKNGEVTGTTTTTASGPYAITLRALGLQIQAAGPTAAARLLTAMGYENASGTLALGTPNGFAPDYTISGTFKWTGWGDYVSGKYSFYMPPALRLLGQSGDGIMGPFDPGKLQPGEPTVCFSAEQSEDLSLKAPDGTQWDGKPNDLRVETPNLLFVAHWSLDGDTMSVHRDFTSKIDQPLCSGTIRALSAAALKRISDSYDVTISFVERGQAGDAAMNAARGFFNSGVSHLNAREYDLAIADFSKAIALKPDLINAYRLRASANAVQRQYSAEIPDLDQLIKLQPTVSDNWRNRGQAYSLIGQYARAIEDFDQALKLNPGDAAALNLRANAQRNLQNLGSLDAARQATKSSPTTSTEFVARGIAYAKLGQNEQALSDFAQAIKLNPDNAGAYSDRSDIYSRLGQMDLALQDLNQAIKIAPNDAGALNNRGALKARLRQHEQALEDFNNSIRAAGHADIAVLNNRSNTYFALKQYDNAIADITALIALDPNSPGAFNTRCWYRAIAKKELDEALADCNEALRQLPDDPATLDSLGFVYFRMANYPAAIKTFDSALALNPRLPASLYVRGQAKARSGDEKGGAADMAAAIALSPGIAANYADYGMPP